MRDFAQVRGDGVIDAADLALLLDSLPSAQRDSVWPLVRPEDLGPVLLEVQDDVSDARLRS